MSKKVVVSARIDGKIKAEATEVLANMGLTVSDACRIVLTIIARDKALPVALKIPNTLTEKTLLESEQGKNLHHAKDVDDLFKQLGA